jgi:hypothetical protein
MKAIHTPTGQIVEAVQWKGDNFEDLHKLTEGNLRPVRSIGHGHLLIDMGADGGSWAVDKGEFVTKTEEGELYVYSSEYFKSFFACVLPTDETPMK